MKQGNHSNAKWALAVAVLVVMVTGGVVFGSNMGFKFNMPIVPQTAAAPQGFNIMSIPYLVPYADRQCLCDQLGLSSSAVVQEFDALAGALDLYLCDTGACGAATGLTPGKATFITDTLGSGSAIVVGAHNPSLNVQLRCSGGAAIPVGDNWASVPYHSTSDSFQDICDEVGPVVTVAEFDATAGALTTYLCDVNPANDSPLTKGRAVKIVLNNGSAACTGAGFVNWVPNHF